MQIDNYRNESFNHFASGTMDFTPIEYNRIKATDTFAASPRFDNPHDVGYLFSEDDDEASEYMRGVLFGGLLIFGCFLLWTLTLCLFQGCFCCKDKTPPFLGFLSGAPFRGPRQRTLLLARLIFFISGIVFIAFCFILHGFGSVRLQNTQNTLQNANQDVEQVLRESEAVIVALRALGQTGDELRIELVDFLQTPPPFCPDVTDPAVLESETGYNLVSMSEELLQNLQSMDNFIDEDLAELLDAISDAKKTVEDVDKGTDDGLDFVWVSFIVTCIFVLLATWMLCVMLLSWWEGSQSNSSNTTSKSSFYTVLVSATSWFGLPLFTLATIVAYLICSAVIILAVINADFCAGGAAKTPDVSLLSIMEKSGYEQDEIAYRAIRYYANQCDAPDPWDFIRSFDSNVEETRAAVSELAIALEAVTVAFLSALCGRDFFHLPALLIPMDRILEALDELSEKALQILACERISPVYARTAYEGVCDFGMRGLTWVFSSSLIIAFFGMLMLTFRSVLWEPQNDARTEVNEGLTPSDKRTSSGRRFEEPVADPQHALQKTEEEHNKESTGRDEGSEESPSMAVHGSR